MKSRMQTIFYKSKQFYEDLDCVGFYKSLLIKMMTAESLTIKYTHNMECICLLAKPIITIFHNR